MRFGLIGCGMIGTLRAAAIAQLPQFRLISVADVDPDRARAVASRAGAAVEPDWRALVRRDDLDAVIVSTTPPLHLEMCVEALRSGKHVLCEKPLARSPEECRTIVDAADGARRHLATGFNYRFYPAIVTAKRVLRSGLVGELDHVRSYAGHPGGREFTHPWVHDRDTTGGGTLVDNGIHILDLTRYFLGEVSAVYGLTTDRVWRFDGCEDNAFALLRSTGGNAAILQSSWSEWRGYRFWIEIYATRGCIRASYPPMLAQVVSIDPSSGTSRRRLYAFPVLQVVERLRSYRWTARQSLAAELTAFADATAGRQTEAASGRDGLRVAEIAHGIYQAARSGGSVALPAV